MTATLTVTNAGERAGADVPQVYLVGERTRLLGFERVELEAGESRTVTVTADPRLLARYDADAGQWHIAGGTYAIAVARSANDIVLSAEAALTDRRFGR